MRIQLTLKDDVGQKIKDNAKAYGLTVSAYCGFILGQTIAATDNVMQAGKDAIKDAAK